MKRIIRNLLVFLMTALLAVGFVGCAGNDGGNSANNVNSGNIEKKLYYQVFSTQEEGKTVRVEITIVSLDGKYTLADIMEKAQEKHTAILASRH